ncbi:glycosyltransferase family 4 protein [Quisquiliibacterium transsilvanicum]|uniref:UDP-N-acetylmuramyl pentapeptide phosphotransferase/UDP-N-acetylglucosamine-1-phosphate transferase n=1 Tax=Quisquiliibacterium transsilvanicum TaxID=1549638 RepID=A0A7W8HK87_9BURK|nr:glycosyltransferase [Quisquiliibacterium transsilvanicum]MBB5273483.1 UDP-N-acetylmuramyl pentapeptide phosphotransferase/UDP-N-acetylglucosamine-1-phosphate transferase [Quisquiliibacterium transsilvanicum]
MISFGIALAVSLLVSLVILRIAYFAQRFGMDADVHDRRRVHSRPVPRIGGLAVLVAMGLGSLAVSARTPAIGGVILLLLASALPAFAGGFLEDLTGRVHPRVRLALMTVAVLLGWLLLDLRIPRVDIPFLDPLVAIPGVGVLLTVLGMLTVTNGINLIDGLNGLAGMVCLAMLCGLAIVGLEVGDPVIVSASLLTAGAVVGFQFWNYPKAHLFLGDGGAYLLGFLLGALSILLVARNPGVSAWFPPLLLAYPLLEVAFSIWRRKVLRGDASGMPDAAHLHHLIYRRVVRWAVGAEEPQSREQRNAFASPYLWVLSSLAVIPAVIFHGQGLVLAGFLLLFVASYIWLYVRIARMRVPRWMIIRPGDRDRGDDK